MTVLRGKLRNDYDVSFRRSVIQLLSENPIVDVAKEEVDTMVERYLSDTGEFPASSVLELLADAMLSKELKDKSPDKLTNTDYAFVSSAKLRDQTNRDLPIGLLIDIDEFINEEMVFVGAIPAKVERDYSGLTNDRMPADSWAMDVKKRDGFRCQHPECNSRNGIMHAHHMYNYADYPELRSELSNGITLCSDCHYGFHRIFGNSRNNPTQLNEYFAQVGC